MVHQEEEGPWVFDTRELVRRPGTMQTAQHVVTLKDLIGTDVMGIQPGQQVKLDLRMESVVEGVLATGSVKATATGECVRCLDPISANVDVFFQELFAYPDRAAHHREVGADDEQDEQRELVQDMMDLEELVTDAVVTTFPFQPVCREDCPGLCSECGAHLSDDPDHYHEVLDPRWSVLADLTHTAPTDDEKRT